VFTHARNWLWNLITDWLNEIPKSNQNQQVINNFDQMLDALRPADVVLFEGRSRVGEVIKIITLSQWTHAALYIGAQCDLKNPDALALVKKHYQGDPSLPLVIESLLGFGTIINPITEYKEDNLRVCRPNNLSKIDQEKVVCFATEHLGMNYDVRQLLDLARLMFPYAILPRQWRSTLFQHNAGRPTNIVCSSMIARCFQSVNYPILPTIKADNDDCIKFHKRNFRLFVPADFDYSPYFSILKFPAWAISKNKSKKDYYGDLPWVNEQPPELKDSEQKKSSISTNLEVINLNAVNKALKQKIEDLKKLIPSKDKDS
jgi:hypothetical protein